MIKRAQLQDAFAQLYLFKGEHTLNVDDTMGERLNTTADHVALHNKAIAGGRVGLTHHLLHTMQV